MEKRYKIALDIKDAKPIEIIELVQGDYDTNVFEISLLENFKSFDLTGLEIRFIANKSDGTSVYQSSVNAEDKINILDATNGILEVTLKTSALEKVGKVKSEIVLYEGSRRLTSALFNFYVRKSLEDNAITSHDDFPLLERVINEGDRIINDAEKATSDAEYMVQNNSLIPKPKVSTYSDISINYPNPENGWTVFVEDEGVYYRYYEGRWIDFSKNNNSMVEKLASEVFQDDTTTITETSDIIDMPTELEKETKVNFKLEGNTVDDGTSTKSTLLAGRLRSENENLIPTESNYWEYGTFDFANGSKIPSSKRIRIKNPIVVPSGSEMVFSVSYGYDIRGLQFDINGNFIGLAGGWTSNSFITSSNCHSLYINIRQDDDNEVDISKLSSLEPQLEAGTTSTPYTPHQEDKTYILGTNSEGEILEMHSIKDSGGSVVIADKVVDGKCNKVTNKFILNGSNSWTVSDDGGSFIRAYTSQDSLKYKYSKNEVNFNLSGFEEYPQTSTVNDLASGGLATLNSSAQYIMVTIEKSKLSTYDNAGVQEFFTSNPATLIYQLAEPKTYELNISPLTVYPNGRIVWENIVTETNEYNSGITINNASLPIQSLDSLYKVNADGSKLKLDVSQTIIASDGLSFTHPDLTTGDLADYDYYYDSSLSTTPTTTLTVPINLNARVNNNTDAISVNAQQVLDIYKILIANNLL